MTQTYLSRFWRRVSIGNDCWTWNGPPGSHGYGQAMREDGSITTAPRMALELCNGDVSQWVLHRCDNKMCVRPSHLYSGSHQENMDDVSRSRNHPKRRLTQAEAEEIRASDEAQRTLAKRYGVSQKAVWMVKHGITYRL